MNKTFLITSILLFFVFFLKAQVSDNVQMNKKDINQIKNKAIAPCNVNDSLALIDFFWSAYNAYNTWDNYNGWLSDRVDNWYGISTDTITGRVISINLHNNNLRGTISESIGDLTHLKTLNLSSNKSLKGSIPNTIGEIDSLKYLHLYKCKFSDSIPRTIGNLVYLEELFLYDNELVGVIPESIGELTKLTKLRLENNNLSEAIPDSIGEVDNIEYMNLSNNQLSDSIPPGLFNHTDLIYLNLSGNSLSGSIPPEIQKIQNLDTLRLNNNSLSGQIPVELFSLINLKSMYLGYNELSGVIPNEISNMNSLIRLDLSNNNLEGNILTPVFGLTTLQEIYLSKNKLTGSIPTSIVNMDTLKVLRLNGNMLSGQIPTQITGLKEILQLGLSDNQLEGSIPIQIGSMLKLQFLSLSKNKLTGALPKEISNASDLKSLIINDNYLDSLADLSGLSNLKTVSVHNNKLDFDDLDTAKINWASSSDYKYAPQTDYASTIVTNSTGQYLSAKLVGNENSYQWYNVSSEVTTSSTANSQLAMGGLSDGAYYCEIIRPATYPDLTLQTIPHAVGSSVSLTNGILSSEYDILVELYDKTYKGEGWIKDHLWKTDTLVKYWYGVTVEDGVHVKALNLSSNRISDTIPSSITGLENLTYLNLSGNSLSELPSNLGSMTNLEVLELHANKLEYLPDLSGLTNLTKLDIRNNILTFGDLEPIMAMEANGTTLAYAASGGGQAFIGRDTIYTPLVGNSQSMSFTTDGTANRYQWSFYGSEIGSESDSPTYTLDNFQVSNQGTYTCEITNTLVPGLTLETANLELLKAFRVIFELQDGMPISAPVVSATVTLKGYGIQTTTVDGDTTFYYVVNEEDIEYSITKPGYYSIEGEITVDDANVEIDTIMPPYSIEYTLSDPSDPVADAEIMLEDYESIHSDINGYALQYPIVPDSNMIFTIKVDGYQDYIDTITISDTNLVLNIDMKFINTPEIQIYPNPTTGEFTMFATKHEENLLMTVYTREGRKLFTRQLDELKKENFNFSFLPKGFYYIFVESKDTKRSVTLILR